MSNNDGKLKREDFVLFLAMQWQLAYSSYSILMIAPKLFRERIVSWRKKLSLLPRKYNSAKKCFAAKHEIKSPQNLILLLKLNTNYDRHTKFIRNITWHKNKKSLLSETNMFWLNFSVDWVMSFHFYFSLMMQNPSTPHFFEWVKWMRTGNVY